MGGFGGVGGGGGAGELDGGDFTKREEGLREKGKGNRGIEAAWDRRWRC